MAGSIIFVPEPKSYGLPDGKGGARSVVLKPGVEVGDMFDNVFGLLQNVSNVQHPEALLSAAIQCAWVFASIANDQAISKIDELDKQVKALQADNSKLREEVDTIASNSIKR